MTASLFSVISYVLISTFTPGPSNISTTSMAVLHGYRNTLKYQAGLALGVFSLMFLSGWLSSTLLKLFPALEPILRYVGAAYILYLAFSILKASYLFADQEMKPLGVVHGLMLQVLNPKLFVYAFTLFAAFLSPLTTNIFTLILVCRPFSDSIILCHLYLGLVWNGHQELSPSASLEGSCEYYFVTFAGLRGNYANGDFRITKSAFDRID